MVQWLQELRKEKGLTQADMAVRLGISEGYYSMIESGQRKARMDVGFVIRVAEVTGTDALALLQRAVESSRR